MLRELRYALRGLSRNPGLAAAAILTLGLGIGANCALFGVVHGLIGRPLPVPAPDQLLKLVYQPKDVASPVGFSVFSEADRRDLVAQSADLFTGIAGATPSLEGLAYRGHAQRVLLAFVSGNYFSVLGLQPYAGRLLRPGEGAVPGADSVLVLGYAFWHDHLGGDPGIVGQTLAVDGHPLTVGGIAPEGFHGTQSVTETAAYLPLAMALPVSHYPPQFLQDRNQRSLALLARLRPGVDLAPARNALALIAARLAQAFPASDRGMGIGAYREQDARPEPDPNQRLQKIAALFLALGGLVLLLACANVANLLLVRAARRMPELALRAALGAGRARLMRQLLLESLLLAAAGGAAGLWLGAWGSRALAGVNFHTSLPLVFDFGFDWRVYAYGCGAALLSGVAAGALPALRASRQDLEGALRSASRSLSGRSRLRSSLVVAELAGSMALLLVAGLFLRSLVAERGAPLGFDPARVMNFTLDPGTVGFSQSQGQAFYRSLLAEVRAMPQVAAAATAMSVPLGLVSEVDHVRVAGHVPPPGAADPIARVNFVSPGLLEVLRIPVRAGRGIVEADGATAPPVAVVNETMARAYWPGQSPLGRTFTLAGDPGRAWRVVGVAGDSRNSSLVGAIEPSFYLPMAQDYTSFQTLEVRVRTGVAPEAVARPIEAMVARLAPGMPVSDVQPETQVLDGFHGFLMFRLGAVLAALLGGLGLVLAVIGVYGVVSYATAQRTHEIGVRIALGARPAGIVAQVLRQGAWLVAAGIAVGIGAAAAMGHAAAAVLGSAGSAGALLTAGAAAVLAATALVACLLPARRAVSTDPLVALRQE